MKTRFVAILALIAVPFFAACGGDVCEDAAEVCGGGSEGEGEGEAECTGDIECFAQCIVDADDCSAETAGTCATDCSGG